jgi:transcription elongation factor
MQMHQSGKVTPAWQRGSKVCVVETQPANSRCATKVVIEIRRDDPSLA